MKDNAFRPAVKAKELDAVKYDTIYIGFPIWWYATPTIIHTFLERINTDGKIVILFATSGGSGFGNTVKELQISAPNATIKEDKILSNTSTVVIANWPKDLK